MYCHLWYCIVYNHMCHFMYGQYLQSFTEVEEAVLHWSGKSVKPYTQISTLIQLLILIYSCNLLMIIGLAAALSAWPVTVLHP